MRLSTPFRFVLPALLLTALLFGAGALRSGSVPLQSGSFQATLNGHTLHYEVHGRGPVLMTMPNSWGLSLDGVRALLRPLESQFTLVYFDPRGIGGSSAGEDPKEFGPAAVRADFDALRQELDLERVHAIGWSNGAINLLLLAADQPEALRSAIYVHGLASLTQADAQRLASEHPELFAKFGSYIQAQMDPERSDEERESAHRAFFLNSYLAALFTDEAAGRAFFAREFSDVELSWRHWLATQQELPVFDMRDRLPEIEIPSLVIAGAHDLAPVEKVRVLHEGLPDSRFVLLAESGHFGPVEQPEQFVKAVAQFIAEVDAAPK